MMRAAIYVHVVAVALCFCETLASRGKLMPRGASDAGHRSAAQIFGLLSIPALIAGFACPVAVCFAIKRSKLTKPAIALSLATEVALCLAQLFALAPEIAYIFI